MARRTRRREPRGRPGSRVFRSLRVPNYRTWFLGQSVSVIGTWMQRVAQDWLVLELTDSAVAVGIAVSLQFLPTLLLGLWGGLLVDRVDRRRLVIVMPGRLGGAWPPRSPASCCPASWSCGWSTRSPSALGFVTVVDDPARHRRSSPSSSARRTTSTPRR